jgi:hypothetical protein
MARSVGLNLSKPIMIVEESCKEIEGTVSSTSDKKSVNELIDEKTVTVIVCLNVTFELKLPKKEE